MPTTFTNLKNNCATVLNTSVDGVTTTLQAVAGGGALFPPTPFYLSCEYEVMRCTGRSADTLTVVRGQDGTTATSHSAGAVIEQRNNAAMWTDISGAVSNIENGTTQIPFSPPDGSITNRMLASDTTRHNLLLNGGLEQWLGPGPFTVHGMQTATDWLMSTAGGAGGTTVSIARDSTNVDTGSTYCAAVTIAVAAAQTIAFYQNLPVEYVRGKTVTFSFRAKTSNVSGVVAYIYYNGGGGGQINSTPLVANNAYGTLTGTATIPVSTTVINIGVSVTGSASGTFYIDNATLVVGSIASSYNPAEIPELVLNSRLALDVARPNLLTNGGFEQWQRGSGSFTTHTAYAADRWYLEYDGATASFSVSRDTSNRDTNTADALGGNYCLAATLTQSGGGGWSIRQKIEAAEVRGRTVTASVRVKSSVPNAVSIRLSDGINPVALSNYHSGSGNYETLSATLSVNVNTSGLLLSIVVIGATSTHYIDNAMLVVGNAPSAYVPLHPADELARCKRYYEKLGVSAAGGFILPMQAVSVTNAMGMAAYQVEKPVTPTVTIGTVAAYSLFSASGSPLGCTSLSASSASSTGSNINSATASGLVAGNATFLINQTGTAFLTVEANP